MKSLSTMVLIAFVMLFTSEAKAQVPKQPPRKKSARPVGKIAKVPKQPPRKKMVDSRLKKCARILAKLGGNLKPTPENCSKLQVVKVQGELPSKKPARSVATKAKEETHSDKYARQLEKIEGLVVTLANEIKAKENPPRDNAIGFGVITDGKFAGGILTAEHIFFKMRWFEIGFAPKFSFLQGELPIIGGFANDDLSVTKFDFTSDFVFKFAPFRWFKLGFHTGVGMRFLNLGDTLVHQNADGTVMGIEAGKSFHFLFAFALVLDFAFTKSLRMSVFYRNTTTSNQPIYFGLPSDGGSSIVEKRAYFDHIGGVTFAILLP